jgi:hypothetical protein
MLLNSSCLYVISHTMGSSPGCCPSLNGRLSVSSTAPYESPTKRGSSAPHTAFSFHTDGRSPSFSLAFYYTGSIRTVYTSASTKVYVLSSQILTLAYDVLGFTWVEPYKSTISRGLQYSTVTILISFVISLAVAAGPIGLAFFKLPGRMILAQNSSAVISAACHCIPVASNDVSHEYDIPLLGMTKSRMQSSLGSEEEMLQNMAVGRLRWGVVSRHQKSLPENPRTFSEYPGSQTEYAGGGRLEYFGEGNPGHLAFRSLEQEVTDVVEGSLYAGLKKR